MLLNCGVDKTLEIPLDFKEIKPVNPKGNQSWICIGRTNAETETPILWPPDVNNWLIRKYPDAGKDWGQEEKGTTEDEMVGWHHQLNAHEFEQAPEVGDGQGGLVCGSPWGHKESDMTEQLNWLLFLQFAIHPFLPMETLAIFQFPGQVKTIFMKPPWIQEYTSKRYDYYCCNEIENMRSQ